LTLKFLLWNLAIILMAGCGGLSGLNITLKPLDINASEPSIINILFQVQNNNDKLASKVESKNILIFEDGQELPKSNVFFKLKNDEKPYISKTIIALDIGNNLSVNEKEQAMSSLNDLILNGQIRINKNNLLMIVVFSEQIYLVQDFTSDKNEVLKSIHKIQNSKSSISSNINVAITQLSGLLKYKTGKAIQNSFLILVTKNRNLASKIPIKDIQKLVLNKKIYSIGIGDSVNEDNLEKIGTSGSYFIDTYSEFKSSLIKIFQDINYYEDSIYLVEYLSPKRKSFKGDSRHILTLKVRDNKNKDGNLEATFNSAQFKSSRPHIRLIPDNRVQAGGDLILTAESVWVNKKGIYEWKLVNTTFGFLTINASNSSQAILHFNNIVGRTQVEVKDTVNNLSTHFPISLGIYKNIIFNFQDEIIPSDLKQIGSGWEIVKDGEKISIQTKKVQDGEATSLILEGYFEGSKISFDYKVESEDGCDEMLFVIDGKSFYDSGLVPWTHSEYPFKMGRHRFEWIYRKDSSTNKYTDKIMIDNIKISN